MNYPVEAVLYKNNKTIVFSSNENTIVIKKILNDKDGINSRIIVEITMLKSLCHNNIIKMNNFFCDSIWTYLILEYCDMTLTKYCHLYFPLTGEQTIGILKQIVEGLKYIHHKNIIHRDIKPDNILIQNGTVKIADFGLSVLITGNKLSYNVVTLYYRAPEILSHIPYGKPIDIWALGCVLYQMSSLRILFYGIEHTQLDVIKEKVAAGIYLNNIMMKDILEQMLVLDANQRITIDALYELLYF